MIYRFTSPTSFTRWKDADVKLFTLDPIGVLYAKVRGCPNPWYVHPVVKGKIDRKTILKPKELDAALEAHFNKSVLTRSMEIKL